MVIWRLLSLVEVITIRILHHMMLFRRDKRHLEQKPDFFSGRVITVETVYSISPTPTVVHSPNVLIVPPPAASLCSRLYPSSGLQP